MKTILVTLGSALFLSVAIGCAGSGTADEHAPASQASDVRAAKPSTCPPPGSSGICSVWDVCDAGEFCIDDWSQPDFFRCSKTPPSAAESCSPPAPPSRGPNCPPPGSSGICSVWDVCETGEFCIDDWSQPDFFRCSKTAPSAAERCGR